jgi:hypothetical protein
LTSNQAIAGPVVVGGIVVALVVLRGTLVVEAIVEVLDDVVAVVELPEVVVDMFDWTVELRAFNRR